MSTFLFCSTQDPILFIILFMMTDRAVCQHKTWSVCVAGSRCVAGCSCHHKQPEAVPGWQWPAETAPSTTISSMDCQQRRNGVISKLQPLTHILSLLPSADPLYQIETSQGGSLCRHKYLPVLKHPLVFSTHSVSNAACYGPGKGRIGILVIITNT